MKSNLDKDIEAMIKTKVSKSVDQGSLDNAFNTIDGIQNGILQAIGILEDSADKCPRALGQIESAFPDTGFPIMRSDFIPIYERIVEVLGNLKDIRDDIYNFRGDYE